MKNNESITVRNIVSQFRKGLSLNWLMTLVETALMTLIPLFIGYAIDGLLEKKTDALIDLIIIVAVLIVISVVRRLYDTRVFGGIRVATTLKLEKKSPDLAVSTLNARLEMGRELVDFLEFKVPELTNALVQLVISFIVLFSFAAYLSYAALAAAFLMLGIYALFHHRFYRLNHEYNHQHEKQVKVLETRSKRGLFVHLSRLKNTEVKLSDTESILYGLIIMVLMGFVIFNLWYATTHIVITVGTIFAIVSYSWEFVESALVLPDTLQGWTRLSEIMDRINGNAKDNKRLARIEDKQKLSA